MALTSGKRLGPYEIQHSIGAGGMGEVYRAHDARLDRTVAVKVLPAVFSTDRERLNRFAQEARAAAALNHPNILSIYDIGEDSGSPYIVSELLEGETLREALRGPLPMRKAIDYALQIARGLAAAHEKGIIHRDLKPENLFITEDGRVKILDFGLAKLTRPESVGVDEDAPTIQAITDSGSVLGTVGYMSPEQVRGRPADARSDIFAFGAILYEMISGKRAFHGDTPADTMSAILKEELPDLSETNRNVPPGLERIVRHCLEKSVVQRFQSAGDLAFDLEALTDFLSSSKVAARTAVAQSLSRASRLRWQRASMAAVGAMLLVAVGWWMGRGSEKAAPPEYQPITFRSGMIGNGRFAPDGSVVFSAQFGGDDVPEIYVARPNEAGVQELGLKGAQLLAVSKKGELAVLLNSVRVESYAHTGTLARVPMSGGAPREVLDNVQDATWAADDEKMAIVRYVPENAHWRLEYPIGTVLLDGISWISNPDISPDGKYVAFLDHENAHGDDEGSVAVIGPDGKEKKLASGYIATQGLHWSPKGDEIWYSAARIGSAQNLRGVTLSGKDRAIENFPSNMWLQDIRDGVVLMMMHQVRVDIKGMGAGAKEERDLGWLGWSFIGDVSRDGTKILIEEEGEGGGPNYSVFLRGMDGSPAIKMGSGVACAISPDKKFVITEPAKIGPLWEIPTGVGEARQITHDNISYQQVRYLPDGKQLVAVGIEQGHGIRDYLVQVASGEVKPLTPEGIAGDRISRDGRFIAVSNRAGQWGVWPIDGSGFRPIPGLTTKFRVAGWEPSGTSLIVVPAGFVTHKLEAFTVEVSSGKMKSWKTFSVSGAGHSIGALMVSSDGNAYAYILTQQLSVAYLVRGLK